MRIPHTVFHASIPLTCSSFFVDTIFCCDWHNINEDTKEFEATNLGPSCPLFAYKDIKRNTK